MQGYIDAPAYAFIKADNGYRLGIMLPFRILRQHLLRAQAEVLKGLLKVIESRLEPEGRGRSTTSEKIPVD